MVCALVIVRVLIVFISFRIKLFPFSLFSIELCLAKFRIYFRLIAFFCISLVSCFSSINFFVMFFVGNYYDDDEVVFTPLSCICYYIIYL